jgi:hypothetical protein
MEKLSKKTIKLIEEYENLNEELQELYKTGTKEEQEIKLKQIVLKDLEIKRQMLVDEFSVLIEKEDKLSADLKKIFHSNISGKELELYNQVSQKQNKTIKELVENIKKRNSIDLEKQEIRYEKIKHETLNEFKENSFYDFKNLYKKENYD